jgi:asparagine synthase (glutamine-hydrolysing)
MCGIVGVLSRSSLAENHLRAMVARLHHRGPDDSGVWVDLSAGIGLGHARLAIIDVSPAGHQPMHSASGRYVITYNGEVYNHLSIRAELEAAGKAPAWIGRSDTESVLAAVEAWGVDATVKKCDGMFAFAVWDRDTRTLFLARDRIGEKPLYYGWQGDTFLVASELKAFKAHPAFREDIDRNAVALMMRYSYIPAPYSIYQNIRKLPPGSVLAVTSDQPDPEPRAYWNGRAIIEQGIDKPMVGSPDEAVNALESLLKRAVAKQMMSDVPLGALLSGGVDSSAVVALMQAQSARPVRTFTIGSHDRSHDEATYAKAVAHHLGTDHTELYVSPEMARDVISRLPTIYCEPFADPSQIPTFLVSELTRRHVTVALSGDGGDELFGGYNRYILGQRLWSKLSRIPVGARVILSRAISGVPAKTWSRLLDPLQSLLPLGMGQAYAGQKMHKGARAMIAQSPLELYQLAVSQWSDPAALVIGGTEPLTMMSDIDRLPRTSNHVEQMMAVDLLTYLPDDLLCKVDRAAMAVSLETRVPFLDHHVVEFAWHMPFEYKLRDGYGKWALRQVLYKYVPKDLIERPKMGFGVPIVSWLRGPLREWAEDLLSEPRLQQEGVFNAAPIRKKWDEHLSGKQDWHHQLWNVLMFQAWRSKR